MQVVISFSKRRKEVKGHWILYHEIFLIRNSAGYKYLNSWMSLTIRLAVIVTSGIRGRNEIRRQGLVEGAMNWTRHCGGQELTVVRRQRGRGAVGTDGQVIVGWIVIVTEINGLSDTGS